MTTNSASEDVNFAESLIKKYIANKNLPQTMEIECCDYVRELLTNINTSTENKSAIVECLKNLGSDVDELDKNGDTAFSRAAWNGQLAVMKLLKLLGCDVNAKDKYGDTPLLAMTFKEDVPKETIELLSSLGANLNEKNKYGKTALMTAIEKGKIELVKLLVTLGSDIHVKNTYQEDAVTIAKNKNQKEIYQFLLNIAHPEEMAKQNLEKSIEKFRSLLSHSPFSKTDAENLSALIKEGGINPNLKLGPDNVPALIFALRNENVEAAKLLITLGADKQCLSEKHPPRNESILYTISIRTSALNMANLEQVVSDKDREIIYLLCQNEIDCNVGTLKNGEELSPVSSAIRLRNTPFLKTLNEYFLNTDRTFAEALTHNTSPDIKKKLDSAKTVKAAGHVLGFTATIANTHSNGFDDFESFPLLRDYISSYATHNPSSLLAKHYNQENSQIKEALDLAIQWQQADGTITHQQFLERYHNGKITIFPVSAQRHSFTLIACNDLLIVCNRGEEQLDEPISVFKIPEHNGEPGRITKAFLESVMPENTKPELAEAVSKIKHLLDIDNNPPLMTFPTKEQKHGTCTFVNIKSSLLPLLFLSELLASSPLSVEGEGDYELDSDFLVLNQKMVQLVKIFQKIEKETQQAYKTFTEDMRTQKVNELCAVFQGPPALSPEDKALYLEIFKAIIKEHHGQTLANRDNRKRTLKMDNEKRRAEQILEVLSPDEKHTLLTELLTNYLNNPKASPKTVAWLKAQDAAANKENIPFTPLRMHVNQSSETKPITEESKPRTKPSSSTPD